MMTCDGPPNDDEKGGHVGKLWAHATIFFIKETNDINQNELMEFVCLHYRRAQGISFTGLSTLARKFNGMYNEYVYFYFIPM